MDNIPNLLKAFVIIGGVALIAGTALLLVMILLRAHGDQPVVQALPGTLSLPDGARVDQVQPDRDRWLLLGHDGAGRQFLAVIDPRTGQRTGLFWLQPQD